MKQKSHLLLLLVCSILFELIVVALLSLLDYLQPRTVLPVVLLLTTIIVISYIIIIKREKSKKELFITFNDEDASVLETDTLKNVLDLEVHEESKSMMTRFIEFGMSDKNRTNMRIHPVELEVYHSMIANHPTEDILNTDMRVIKHLFNDLKKADAKPFPLFGIKQLINEPHKITYGSNLNRDNIDHYLFTYKGKAYKMTVRNDRSVQEQ